MRVGVVALVLAASIAMTAAEAASQTLSPPLAEYRKKADGVLTLGNDGDAALAAILEVREFSVDGDGNLAYGPAPSDVKVELGSNSFVIPPHQTHYVFYRASCAHAPCWFAIINTLTRATAVTGGLRINIVLPHLVYVYQKAKFKKSDVRVEVSAGEREGVYRLKFENFSDKLERVETVQARGFPDGQTYGGFPLFPRQTRSVSFQTGAPSKRASFRIQFGGGLHFDVPLSEEPAK